MNIRTTVLAVIGTVGAALSGVLGGFDSLLNALLLFMGMDFLLGFVVAGVFRNSNKSVSGALDSRAGFKGVLRKGGILLCVILGTQFDILLGSTFARYGVIIAFLVNESLSILENITMMGVPIPETLKKALDLLHKKEEVQDDEESDD